MALKVIDETTLNVCCTTPLYYLLSFSNFDAINITAREVTLKNWVNVVSQHVCRVTSFGNKLWRWVRIIDLLTIFNWLLKEHAILWSLLAFGELYWYWNLMISNSLLKRAWGCKWHYCCLSQTRQTVDCLATFANLPHDFHIFAKMFELHLIGLSVSSVEKILRNKKKLKWHFPKWVFEYWYW